MNNNQNGRDTGRPAERQSPRSETQRQQSYPRPRPTQPREGQRPPQRPTPREGYRTPPGRSPSRRGPTGAPQSYRSYNRKGPEDFLVWFLVVAVVLLIALIITFIAVKNINKTPSETESPSERSPSVLAGPATVPSDGESSGSNPPDTSPSEEELKGPDGKVLPNWKYKPSNMRAFIPQTVASTEYAEGLNSEFGIIVSLSDNKVLASKKSDEKMYPASLTKMMTVIVACENITDMSETATITLGMIAPLESLGASLARFQINEPIYLIDLIYGAWLPSGADATAALAVAIAGSEEEFVKLMNAKAAELGCTRTHFANPSGLHDENNYSTVRDMATILSYAVQNPLIRSVLSTDSYTPLSPMRDNYVSLRATWDRTLSGLSQKDYSFFVGAKTGYEDFSGSCMASLLKDEQGNEYVAVTVNANATDVGGNVNAFRDAKTLFETYVK